MPASFRRRTGSHSAPSPSPASSATRARSAAPTDQYYRQHHRWRDHRQRRHSGICPRHLRRQCQRHRPEPDCDPGHRTDLYRRHQQCRRAASRRYRHSGQRQHDFHRRHFQQRHDQRAPWHPGPAGLDLQRRHQQFRHARFAGLGGHSCRQCRFVRHHQYERRHHQQRQDLRRSVRHPGDHGQHVPGRHRQFGHHLGL